MRLRDVSIAALYALAEKDERIVVMTGDLGFTILDPFINNLPKQYINAGIAEQNMAGMAAGLALEGKIVFIYSIANFPTFRCLEQIRNDICYHELNVNILASGCGLTYGQLGMTHHATEDLAILRALPEMTVIAPGDEWECMEATKALVDKKGPGYLRFDISTAGNTQKPGEVFQIGRARRIREGFDITLLSTGGMLIVALNAADMLQKKGIECRVVSFHSIKPFEPDEILLAARETGGMVTLEEHTVDGGFGGLVSEVLMDHGIMPKTFYRVGLRDGFTAIVGDQQYLRKRYKIDEESIVGKVGELLGK